MWIAQNMKHFGVNPTENQNTAVHRADAHDAHADDDDERESFGISAHNYVAY